jgi:bacterioferritin-associated ferredoxin
VLCGPRKFAEQTPLVSNCGFCISQAREVAEQLPKVAASSPACSYEA